MIFNHRNAELLNVIEVNEIIDEGITFPVRCRLSEEIDAVVKYPKNPAGLSVLINEWVGNLIADAIGLTIPQYGLCFLSKEVIEATNCNEEIDSDNSGVCFYSKLINNTAPATRRILMAAKNKETERIILFDHLVDNKDRHDGNLIYKVSKDRTVYLIDCSHIVVPYRKTLGQPLDLDVELSDEMILNDSMLTEENNIYDILCETMGYKESVLYRESERIKKTITPDSLEYIQESIPSEWRVDIGAQRITDMFEVLNRRFMCIDEITEMIAKERRTRQWKKY